MGGVQRRDPPAWLRGREGTLSQWCHTVLKGQQAPGGSRWLSITNSLHELTASIRPVVEDLVALSTVPLSSGSRVLARPHLLGEFKQIASD